MMLGQLRTGGPAEERRQQPVPMTGVIRLPAITPCRHRHGVVMWWVLRYDCAASGCLGGTAPSSGSGYFFTRKEVFMDRRITPIALSMLLIVGAGCGKTVDSGHRGVYYNWRTGTDTEHVLGEGFHWLAPWNKLFQYDVRTKDRLEKLDSLSKDQLQIRCDVSIRYSLVPNKVGQLHERVGPDYYRMLIQPILRNTTRDVMSGYKSVDAHGARKAIQEEIADAIRPALTKYNYFSVDRVMLRHMEFPQVVVQAIERKLAMNQEAEREKFALEKARIAAERKLVDARATAKAQAILKAEINDTLLRWKGIEATLSLAESPNTKVVVVGGGKDGLPLILGGAGK